MAIKPLTAQVRHQPGTAVIDLQGEINAGAEHILNEAYANAVAQHPNTVLLNFKDVDYINSTGIALIVGLMAQARKSDFLLIASGLKTKYQEMFQVTRLADFMGIYPDEASALES